MEKDKKAIIYNILIPGKGDRYINKSILSNIIYIVGIVYSLTGLGLIIYLLYYYQYGFGKVRLEAASGAESELIQNIILVIGFLIIPRIISVLEVKFRLIRIDRLAKVEKQIEVDQLASKSKEFSYYCSSCKKETELTTDEIKKGMFTCPDCNVMNLISISNKSRMNVPSQTIIHSSIDNSFSTKHKSTVKKSAAFVGVSLIIVLVIIILSKSNNNISTSNQTNTTNTQKTSDANKTNEEALNATLRDFNNAFRSCNPSNCASYYKDQKMRDQYSKNLSGMFDEYGCPKSSDMSDIKITSITETSAEVTFRWVWFCNFEKENRFYRGGVYAGPFTKGNRLMQATFEKGPPGWQLTKMKTLEKGKDERSWSLSEWKRMR